MRGRQAHSRRSDVSCSGLTIIEVLVAIAMLGVIAAAVFGSVGALTALNRSGQADLAVIAEARSSLEQLRQWASPSDVFDDVVVDEDLVFVNAFLVGIAGEVACEAVSLTDVIYRVVARIDVTCVAPGASSPAAFTVDVVREGS